MTSPLGFEARVGSALIELSGGVHVTRSLRYTSGATPAVLLVASMAAKPSLPHTYEALVGLEAGNYHAAAHSGLLSPYSDRVPRAILFSTKTGPFYFLTYIFASNRNV